MLTVVCVNAGNYCGRGKQYVETLHDMVNRNLSDKQIYNFVCFTDDPEPYEDSIEKRPLHGQLEGWWNKLYLFKKGHFHKDDLILYLDLDTCVVSGLDSIIKYEGDFAILRDVYRPEGLQSSVMLWRGDYSCIWTEFEKENFPLIEGGDQAWIERMNLKPVILQQQFPHQFVSYKERAQFQIPKDAKVVFFHGHPRPHECLENWVPKIWKIAGGSVLELEIVVNVSEEAIEANVRHSCALPIENLADQYMKPHDNQLIIVGGGPSLIYETNQIRDRQMEGCVIWALNNTFKFLRQHGVHPDAHIMLDARKENAEFVPEGSLATKLYASQCHPDVFDKALQGPGDVILWHHYDEKMLAIMTELKRKVAFIGAGSSVGLKALTLAQLFGFRHLHLFGYDSSYRDDKNHAYEQELNRFEKIIKVTQDDREFTCAPWMATQANEFKECIPNFLADGLTISVHGDGLIPYIANRMQKHD